jgi:hypothetical protein
VDEPEVERILVLARAREPARVDEPEPAQERILVLARAREPARVDELERARILVPGLAREPARVDELERVPAQELARVDELERVRVLLPEQTQARPQALVPVRDPIDTDFRRTHFLPGSVDKARRLDKAPRSVPELKFVS